MNPDNRLYSQGLCFISWIYGSLKLLFWHSIIIFSPGITESSVEAEIVLNSKSIFVGPRYIWVLLWSDVGCSFTLYSKAKSNSAAMTLCSPDGPISWNFDRTVFSLHSL